VSSLQEDRAFKANLLMRPICTLVCMMVWSPHPQSGFLSDKTKSEGVLQPVTGTHTTG